MPRCATGSPDCAPRSTRRPPPVRPDRPPDEPSGWWRMSGGLILAIESSCDETGIALIEDGRRIVANVVASQVALHAPTGGIVPEVAARAHLRWIVPVLDEAWADAGASWDDVGRGRRDLRPGPRRIAPRRDQLRQDARLGPRQAARRRQPPRGPRLRRLAARPRRGRPTGSGLPARRAGRVGRPHVPRRDARPPDLPAARHDRRRRRRRGVRQGRPAARPGLSGRAGDRARRRGRDAARPGLPAGLARRFVRPQLLRAQDRGAPDRHRGPRRRRPGRRRRTSRSPTPSSPSSPGGSRTRSSTCSPRRRSGPPRRPAPARS